MAHLALEMGQDGHASLFSLFPFMSKLMYITTCVCYVTKTNNKNFHKYIHSFCLYELYEHNKHFKKVAQLASLSPIY